MDKFTAEFRLVNSDVVALRIGAFKSFDFAVKAAKQEATRLAAILVGVRLSK